MVARLEKTSGSWRWPKVRPRSAAAMLGLVLTIALIQAMTVRAALLVESSELPAYAPFVWHMSGALGVWFALPVVQCAILNAPGPQVGWMRMLAVHVAGFCAFASLQLSVMFSLRALLRVVLAVHDERHSFGYQILWDAQNDLVIYAGLVALLGTVRAWEERNREALRASQLESRLAAARLEALTMQLDPHFLYNSLNSMSALMYEDLTKAERMIANLGQLLRATLEPREPTWCLADELAHAKRYVDLLTARLEERLLVEWQVAEELDCADVPRLCVQTLIENALKHNHDRCEPLHIGIKGWQAQGLLHLQVDDDGRGFDATDASTRLRADHGLGRLNEMLQLLYGAEAGVRLGRSDQGGARVSLLFHCRQSVRCPPFVCS
jgi:signal transduction histidine kinase